jgi:hypothetical protein
MVSFTLRVLYPLGKPPVSIGEEAVWAREPVWTLLCKEKSFGPDKKNGYFIKSECHFYYTIKYKKT